MPAWPCPGRVLRYSRAAMTLPPDTPPNPSFPLPRQADVVVVGAGPAGLAAALAARAAGAFVVVLDAAPPALFGGNARHGRNIRAANAAPTPFQRDRYLVAEFAADLARMGSPDPVLAQALAEGSADLADWLQRQGVRLEPWVEGNLPYSRRTVFLRGGGQALVNALLARARAQGVVICDRASVEALDPALLDNAPGPFRLTVARGDTAQSLLAGAVVLACGGFGANRSELARALGPGAMQIANRGTPEQSGTPILWALARGAALAGQPGDGHFAAVDARAPRHDAGIVSRVDGMALGIVVGADGLRFADEGAVTGPERHSFWARQMLARPDPRGWIVLGAAAMHRLPPMLYPPISAPDAPALAALCGIDPVGLARSLAAPLGLASVPPRSGPPPDLTPPLRAIPMLPGLAFTRYGLAVDAMGRVRLASGGLVGGGVAARFFAAGTAMCGAVLGRGYLSGTGLTIALVFGRKAGQAAAQVAGRGLPQPMPQMPARSPEPALETAPDLEAVPEAGRALNICNTCGFCTGLCDVFPAAARRPLLASGDLRHLAHLCHDCRSCAHDCQYAPPHELAVNLPAVLANTRLRDTDGAGRGAVAAYLACVLGLPAATALMQPVAAFWGTHGGPGAFYAVIPHGIMTGGAGAVFGFALFVLALRGGLFWRATAGPPVRLTLGAAARGLVDAVTLRNLADCEDRAGPIGQGRRRGHHLLLGGFTLTFLATVAGYVLHHAGQIAPYPLLSLPVVLGTVGGVAMLVGLFALGRTPAPDSAAMARANRFARWQLGAMAGTGLALLGLRDTPAMGLLLAAHLGTVAGFAVLLPFGKLAHGLFRGLALIRHTAERAALDKSRPPKR